MARVLEVGEGPGASWGTCTLPPMVLPLHTAPWNGTGDRPLDTSSSKRSLLVGKWDCGTLGVSRSQRRKPAAGGAGTEV